MTEHPLIGLAAALLVEARNWTRLRWDFDEPAFLRAWHITVLLILFGAITVWLDGPSSRRIYGLFAWMPVLLLPVQFVQSYGTRTTIPLHVFTVAARRRIERERRLGRLIEVPEIAFGHVLLVSILLGAALGRNAGSWLFLPGILVLVGWELRSTRSAHTRWPAWLATLVAVTALGFAGQLALRRVNELFASGMWGPGDRFSDFTRSRIALGGLGEHKNSSRISWRLRDLEGGWPELLRTASYNTYLNGQWIFRNRVGDRAFEPMTLAYDDQGHSYRLASDEFVRSPAPPELPRFNLVGAVNRNSLLPLPPGTRSLRDSQADALDLNPVGTVRIEPKHGILDTTVTWADQHDLESPPWPGDDSPDLRIPSDEKAAVLALAGQLDLQSGGLVDKVSRLRLFFLREFEYARYLDLDPPTSGPSDNAASGAIGRFLNLHRRGHCEYFATATTLLLRAAGVPARYAIGFAAVEHLPDDTEIVLRGTHAHAWCRAWDDAAGRWVDVDLTPPDWTAREQARLSLLQRLGDRWQRLREDLLAWRTRPGNAERTTMVMTVIGLLVAGYVAVRLWQSRRLAPHSPGSRRHLPAPPAELRPLVRSADRRIGPRPPGMPLGRWLRQLEPALGRDPELAELIAIHARLRFDPDGPAADDRSRLAQLARSLSRRLHRRPPPATRRPHICRG